MIPETAQAMLSGRREKSTPTDLTRTQLVAHTTFFPPASTFWCRSVFSLKSRLEYSHRAPMGQWFSESVAPRRTALGHSCWRQTLQCTSVHTTKQFFLSAFKCAYSCFGCIDVSQTSIGYGPNCSQQQLNNMVRCILPGENLAQAHFRNSIGKSAMSNVSTSDVVRCILPIG